MMPVKTQIPSDHGIFFITFTCFRWISLIDITNSYDLVYKWFDYLTIEKKNIPSINERVKKIKHQNADNLIG